MIVVLFWPEELASSVSQAKLPQTSTLKYVAPSSHPEPGSSKRSPQSWDVVD